MENCQRSTRKVKSSKKGQKKNEEPYSNADLPGISEVETTVVIDKPINKRKRKDCSVQEKQSTSASGPKYVPKFKKKKTTNPSKGDQDKDKTGKKAQGNVKDKINILETVPHGTDNLVSLQEKKETGENESVYTTVQTGMKGETEKKREELISNTVKEITIKESTDTDENKPNIAMREDQRVTENTDEKTGDSASKPVDVDEVKECAVDRFEHPDLSKLNIESDRQDGMIIQINNETIDNSGCKPVNEMKVDNIVMPELVLNNKKSHDVQLSNGSADSEELMVGEIKEMSDKPEILINEMKTTCLKYNKCDKMKIVNKWLEMETDNVDVAEIVNKILKEATSETESGLPDKECSTGQVSSVTMMTDHNVELVNSAISKTSIPDDTSMGTNIKDNVISSIDKKSDFPKNIEINNEVTDRQDAACQPVMEDDQIKQILKPDNGVEEALSGLISDVVMSDHGFNQKLINKQALAEDMAISNVTVGRIIKPIEQAVKQVTNEPSCIEPLRISIVTEDISTDIPGINTDAELFDTNETINILCIEKGSKSNNHTTNSVTVEMLQGPDDVGHDTLLNPSETVDIVEKKSNMSNNHSTFDANEHIKTIITKEQMINKHSSTDVGNDLLPDQSFNTEVNNTQKYDIPEVNSDQNINKVNDRIITTPVCNRTVTTTEKQIPKACDAQVVTGIPHKASDDILMNSSTGTCTSSIVVDGAPQLLKVKHGNQEPHVPSKIRNNQTYNDFKESTTKNPEENNKIDSEIYPKVTTGIIANSCVLEMLPEYHSSDLQELDEDMLDITDSQMCQVDLEYSTPDNISENTKSNKMKKTDKTDEKFQKMLQEKKNEGSRQIMGIIRDLHQFNNWLTSVSQQISQSNRNPKHHRYNMNK